jgi:hypothetical protein
VKGSDCIMFGRTRFGVQNISIYCSLRPIRFIKTYIATCHVYVTPQPISSALCNTIMRIHYRNSFFLLLITTRLTLVYSKKRLFSCEALSLRKKSHTIKGQSSTSVSITHPKCGNARHHLGPFLDHACPECRRREGHSHPSEASHSVGCPIPWMGWQCPYQT